MRLRPRYLLRWLGLAALAMVLMLVGAWCALAVWFRWDSNQPADGILAGALAILALVIGFGLVTSRRRLALTGYVIAVAAVLVWWSTILPSNNRDWALDVARNATATVDGDTLTVHNVRNFNWRSDTDFDPRWESRVYDLSQLTHVDLVLSYWAGEAIAHLIVSFGFEDGRQLDFSIETRKQRGEEYSTIAGFFKQYELVIIAAEERDIVRVRSNVRGEDVRIYRLRMPPLYARKLLLAYAEDINDLARTPRWYNTLTSNCTTLAFAMVRTLRPGLPLDYRVLLSGYLPNYTYDLGATDTSMPFAELRSRARIRDRAVVADDDPDFSARIREGIPTPR